MLSSMQSKLVKTVTKMHCKGRTSEIPTLLGSRGTVSYRGFEPVASRDCQPPAPYGIPHSPRGRTRVEAEVCAVQLDGSITVFNVPLLEEIFAATRYHRARVTSIMSAKLVRVIHYQHNEQLTILCRSLIDHQTLRSVRICWH
jgi:hypothetical protein